MALFGNNPKPDSYEIVREGDEDIMRIDYEDATILPSIEDNPVVMGRTIDKLMESPNVSKIVFIQKRDYEYDFAQTQVLAEIARLYKQLIKQRDLVGYQAVAGGRGRMADARYTRLQNIIMNLMKTDPVGAYIELKRFARNERIEMQKTIETEHTRQMNRFVQVLDYIVEKLEATRLITLARPHIAGYEVGDRSVYRRIFTPFIKPDFMFTKLMSTYPVDAEEMANYTVGDDIEITIFKQPDNVQYIYHVIPPEFKLDEDKYELLDMARKIMAEHKPKKSEFVDPKRMRQVFFNVGHDLLEELADYKNIRMRGKDLDKLTNILVRYTVGFGLIEVLLADEKIQDISINSPMGKIPMFIVHGDFDDCTTNIVPTRTEAESWASKLRLISGRPLDEADPILDTELELPGASTRVSVIAPPLNPTGLAYSFRRHRDRPWTLPLFIKNRTINDLAAGLYSFLIDGTRAMLIAGTRSSGKTSFLSGLLIEIMRRYRMITIEDTLELPTGSMRDLGFNIQPMKVASALARGGTEMDATDGIRSTLRLGDSALIVGEVRSKEAVALYEAMRVGAAANVVAGTIHSDSPYGVFDRVVNDIGVPKTSFKATDIITVVNPIKSADGMHKFRRVLSITEVRKFWNEDPVAEGGFVDLMKYDARQDTLVPTDELVNGDSECLKTIAGNVRDFAGNWDAVWQNIQLRANIKKAIVDVAEQYSDPELLEAEFVIRCNDAYHIIAERVKEETGVFDNDRIFYEWMEWLKRDIKKRKMIT
ncbi:type II/IV secretion system ATPase subunit [Candidatus Woesearchaeota archaeon]|nr:type II/IV secretion system ATPase subunit [Candidatus Woesearchaeota archaeon]